MIKSIRVKRLLSLLPLLALFLPSITYAARHAVVLQYQHISDRTPPSKSASEKNFIEHLDYLEQNNYKVWPLEKIVKRLKNKRTLPDKVVAITFDNAYISVFENALPQLARRELPFTVFVAAAPIIKEHPLYMSWKQLREVQRQGGTIGSMGLTASNMAKPMPEEFPEQQLARLKKDLELNEKAIQTKLNIKPTLFAYPQGQANEQAKKLIKRMGYTGFGLQQGPASRFSSFSYQPRFKATGTAKNINNLAVKLSSLPLPVRRVKAGKTLLLHDNKYPEAVVQLYSGSYVLSGLRCKNAQGLPVSNYPQPGKKPSIMLKSKLGESVGPVEYYCTAPHDKSSRFYWFSHTWIRPDKEGRW
jgi:peptidoglycan/xylan/chitin deacetylase (PgdA/CDA1 family)